MGRTKGALNKKTVKAIAKAEKQTGISNIKFIADKLEKKKYSPAQEAIKENIPVEKLPVENKVDDSEALNDFKETYGTQIPETNEPETTEPETNEPETTEPETNEPETTEPETTEPETTEPETNEPETNEEEIDYSKAEEAIKETKEDLDKQKLDLAKKKEYAAISKDGGNQKTDNLFFITNLVAPFLIKNANKIGADKEKRDLINKIDSYEMRLTEKQKQRMLEDGAVIETAEKYIPMIDPAIRAVFNVLGCYQDNYQENLIQLKDNLDKAKK